MKKEILRNNYEQLREYCLSPAKTPARPLGLDLWNKKGFLSWSAVIFCGEENTQKSVFRVLENPSDYAQAGSAVIPEGLSISLANILMDWSDENVGQQNQRRAFEP